MVSQSDRSCTTWFTGFASVAPERIETSTRKLFTSEISQHSVEQSPASCVGRRCHRRGPVLVSNVPRKETQALAVHCLVRNLGDHLDCLSFCTIRLVRSCPSRYCSLLSTRSCRLHSCTLSATFLTASPFAFVASLWPCPGCPDPRCASCAPPDRLLIDQLRFSRSLVLSVDSGNVTSFTVSCVKSPPSVSWSKHPTEGYDFRDRSLWLFAAYVSSNKACPMISRHPSLGKSYLSAHLRFAAYISPVSCTREYASCAHRETTLCASRKSSVHHCLSLKAVLSSRLRESTTAWSVEAFNTTNMVGVRGETSRVPSFFLSCTAAHASPTHASEFCLQVFIRGLL